MTRVYDVAILGSGMSGSMLACILAKQGMDVLVLDGRVHPRFAVGESTIPQTSQLHTLLSMKFDVPELHEIGLASPGAVRDRIGLTSGIKRIFGFVYHSKNERHEPAHGIQFGNTWRDENHFFRQDVDAYLMHAAIRYGTSVHQGTRVESVEVTSNGVELATSAGAFQAKYVVDGSGFRSPLAERYGLRDKPCRLRHHSRTLFTHMIDVTPFEDCTENPLTVGWSKGTLHHVFRGGWIWVIPFNNWEGSTNQLVSVGLTLDPRVHPPKEHLDPEQEFRGFLTQFPDIEKQFANARSVRPWVRTGRLQYSSSATTGSRFCLTAHAAGFVDPLFSRGLINNAEVVQAIADSLLEAHADNDYSPERFLHLEDLQTRVVDFADRLATASFASWDDFDLWNAWLRVWAIGTGSVESNLGGYLAMYNFPDRRREPLDDYLFSPFEDAGYKDYFERCWNVMSKYREGTLTGGEASQALFQQAADYGFEMPLLDGSTSHYWAIRNPGSRDLFIGKPELHERWAQQLHDPHLG